MSLALLFRFGNRRFTVEAKGFAMLNARDSSDFVENPLGLDPLSTGARSNGSSSPAPVTTAPPIAAPTTATVPPSISVKPEDERDAARKRSVYKALCKTIRSCAAPTTRSNKWDFLAINDSLFRIDIPPRELVITLEQHCAREELTAFGISERLLQELRTSSWLESNTHIYAAIDEVKGTIKFSRGNRFSLPATRSALDHSLERNPPDSAPAAVTLFVVESRESVEVLQKLGLSAAGSEGLAALTGKDVQKIFRGDQQSDVGWRYDLLLLDFHVAALDSRPTAAIGEVITRLADAADLYGIDPARRFNVCRPRGHEFRMLESATKFADSEIICRLIESWALASKGTIINNWRTQFDTRAPSYARASAALTHALQLQDVARRAAVLDAFPVYCAAGRTVVVEKFMKAADAAIDSFDRMDLIAAVGFAQAFFDFDPLALAAEAVLAGENPPSPRELQVAFFEQRQRIMSELRRIRRDRSAKR